MRRLLVEDDAPTGAAARRAPCEFGLVCDWVQTATGFCGALATQTYDRILLDLTLPDGHGAQLLEAMRRSGDPAPVIVVTGQGQHESSVDLLHLGADDYIVTLCDIRSLMARVRAVLCRAHAAETSNALVHGPLVLDVDRRIAVWHGELVPLTKKEYCLP